MPDTLVTERDCLAPLYAPARLELISGKGSWVTDSSGTRYLDFASGIAVNALGHAPAALASAVARQMRRLVHCSNLFANRPAVELAQALTTATGYDSVFFCNSGSEGVEAALKFARLRAEAGGRRGRGVVAFRGGFHGRTAFALSTTWNPAYREPFEPLVGDVLFGEFNSVADLDALIDGEVAAVLIEPIQGENGAVAATPEFLQALREKTAKHGAALIFDEVQCGLGRCGHLLAAEHYGVTADYTVLSKALAGGLPMAAVLMSQEATLALAPGLHGSTFGGGPVTATAACHVLETLCKPGFLERVRRRSQELATGLSWIVSRHPSLATERGLGLLRAIETSANAPFNADSILSSCRDHGLLLVGSGKRAFRFLPALTVTAGEIQQALTRFEAAVTELELMKGSST